MRKLIITGIFGVFGAATAQADIVSTFNADTRGGRLSVMKSAR